MSLITINVWWAGHRLDRLEVSEGEVDETIGKWQLRLNSDEDFFASVGVKMKPTGLCIDVLSEGKLISQRDLKPK